MTKQRMLLASSLVLVAGIIAQASGVAQAKDAPVNPGNVPVTTGPCNEGVEVPGETIWYTLQNDKYPGYVAPEMWINGSIRLKSVCLEPGWTYTQQSASNGVQLRFFYNGVRAIDFKFVSGKTDIRNY